MAENRGTHGRVVIIGAGVGGVATAARLAKAGFEVTVVEKNDFTGGRCSLIHQDGFRFDQGPSLLLLPQFFKEIFEDLGTSLSSEDVELLKCEPNYNIWFGDGESLQLSSDLSCMKSQIERFEGKDGFERYFSFLQESHRHYELSVEHVLRKNYPSLLSLLSPAFLRHLFALHPFESIYSRASRYFWTERLRRAFTFASMYMGMSPFDAPGTYSLLQYTEFAEGVWYPRGGFHRIVEKLVTVGERLGVKYQLSAPVSSIVISEHGKATGVRFEDGQTLSADLVVCNADLVWAYNHLLSQTSYAKSLSQRPGSCSSISFYWGLKQKVSKLHTHNIFLADEYRESFDSIFKENLIPTKPSFYVNVPSRIDPTAAPDGKDAVAVLVPVGHLMGTENANHKGIGSTSLPSGNPKNLREPQDWATMVQHARSTITATILARTGVDLDDLIESEYVNTPLSWKDLFNLDKGAILGLSHSFFNVLSFRPHTKHSHHKGLYFVGASTHPGTGVPICLAGSKIVAEQILRDQNVRIPWIENNSPQPRSNPSSSMLDRMARRQDRWQHYFALASLCFGLLLYGALMKGGLGVAWLGM